MESIRFLTIKWPVGKRTLRLALLVAWLAIALIVETGRLLADEDNIGYLREFYREDDHRMSVETDSVRFDVGLGSHVRLNGTFVNDAISGATPTGAPPQSQWPFPKFSDYYRMAYGQLFQAAINDPNNLVLYQSGYFANIQAYTNYVATNNPQLMVQATNNAASAYQTLTNNPKIHNRSVPLTDLSDHRRAFSLGAPILFGMNRFTPETSISMEHDYHSYGFALNDSLFLNEKNTTLNMGWSHNADRVRDSVFIWEPKVSDEIFIGLNQILTPQSYFSVAVTYGQEYGYLSDPYRGVMTTQNLLQLDPNDAALIPEKRPRRRNKEILFTSFTQFVEPLEGSAELSYRFFHDSYDVFAQTAELDWHQKVGDTVVLTPMFRYYYQTAASFYNVIFPDANNMPTYYSSDYRLSRLDSFSTGVTLYWRIHKHLSVDVSYMRYFMQGLDGVTSQSAYPRADVYTVGGRIWF